MNRSSICIILLSTVFSMLGMQLSAQAYFTVDSVKVVSISDYSDRINSKVPYLDPEFDILLEDGPFVVFYGKIHNEDDRPYVIYAGSDDDEHHYYRSFVVSFEHKGKTYTNDKFYVSRIRTSEMWTSRKYDMSGVVFRLDSINPGAVVDCEVDGRILRGTALLKSGTQNKRDMIKRGYIMETIVKEALPGITIRMSELREDNNHYVETIAVL